MKKKKIKILNKVIGTGLKYLGWSGRGLVDGGSTAAGSISCLAPSWDSYSQEIGINMIRMGFSIKHFLSGIENTTQKILDEVKRGLENTRASWAKSAQTSYSYAIQRCQDLGWKLLICINPSYTSPWDPVNLTSSADYLNVWKNFCFSLAKAIDDNWPRIGYYFEITNEPDIGYFDGEAFLPAYHGPSGGISPSQYCLLLKKASEGIKEALPEANIFGPALASWNKGWTEEVLDQAGCCLDGLSYHNVAGHLNDEDIIKEANLMLSQYAPHAAQRIVNSEWAWWPDHDSNHLETALRAAQILYQQTKGQAFASLYLGPAQPKGFKRGLGVIKFNPDNPNQAERTKTFFAFRLMARGVVGEKQLEVFNPCRQLKILALIKAHQEIVITIINPGRKKYRHLSICIDEAIPLKREPLLKLYRFDDSHSDRYEKSDYKILDNFDIGPKTIIQFVL